MLHYQNILHRGEEEKNSDVKCFPPEIKMILKFFYDKNDTNSEQFLHDAGTKYYQ